MKRRRPGKHRPTEEIPLGSIKFQSGFQCAAASPLFCGGNSSVFLGGGHGDGQKCLCTQLDRQTTALDGETVVFVLQTASSVDSTPNMKQIPFGNLSRVFRATREEEFSHDRCKL